MGSLVPRAVGPWIGDGTHQMGSVGRYIFRTTLGAFVVVLVSVTILMWITQALRNVDLMTSQGQSLLAFVGITGLIIPLLVMIIAPFALMIAIAHVLTKLGNDSELIVMNSAGMPPWRVFRPFLAVGVVVALLVAFMGFYLSPKCLQELRRWATNVRAEIVTSNVQPGRFIVIDNKLTLHIRERRPNGQLAGIMVDDQRDPKERATIIAERGDILTTERGVFLLLSNGAVHRQEAGQRDPAIVKFKDYAFDLSRLSPEPTSVTFSVHERFTSELINPPPNDPAYRRNPGQFQSELHNRFLSPLYPLAFLVVTFAYLGAPRTTRQSRTLSLVSAMGLAGLIRGLGFVSTIAGAKSQIALYAPYAALSAAFILGGIGIARGIIIEPPAFVTNLVNLMVEGVLRRTTVGTGSA
jgi:lipopolysaccharide export system permease protein